MRVDITSMFFNSKIEGKTATPAWSTSIGENDIRSYKLGVSQLIDSLTLNVCIDKEHLDLSGGSDSCDLLYFCVFDQVSVNGILLPDISYIIYLVREHSNSHEGRIRLCYPPYAKYTKAEGTIVWNENSNREIAKSIGCTPEGCWFVYDISVVNQHTLNFDTKVVNNSAPVIYKGESKDRSAIWNGMLMENNDIPTERELGEILGQMYKTADTGFQVASIYVFGVKYGKYLSNYSLKKIIQYAELSSSFESELSKAYKLYQSISKNKYNISSSAIIEKLLSEKFNLPLQQIFYGAPGTGKSHKVKEVTDTVPKSDVFRTTFHPDSDYSTFVGCYKPTQEETTHAKQPILDYDTLVDKFKEYLNVANVNITKACTLFGYDYHDSIIEIQKYGKKVLDLVNDAYKSNTSYDSVVRGGMTCYESHPTTNNTNSITYQFVPQAFTKAYCEAWNNYNPEGESEPVFLIIEEINRGNCAQIFGDIFQLLDRKDGFSEYPIDADEDLKKFLLNGTKEDGTPWLVNKDGIKDGKLCLPPNLHIWATMNTSDQSLFPIDSAFKRRWDWEYVPIKRADKEPENKWIIKVAHDGKTYWCYWWEFLEAINHQIEETTHSEDKQLGYFFAKPKAGENFISAETFVNKVIFYLWNDVFKDEDSAVFQYDNDMVEDVSINRSGTMYFRHFMENKDEMIHYFINQLFAMGKDSTPVVPIDYLKNDADSKVIEHLPKMRELGVESPSAEEIPEEIVDDADSK